MSVLEPQPAQGGFLKVVSIKVQRSPLKPQFPEQETLGSKRCLNVVSHRFEDNWGPHRDVSKRARIGCLERSTHAIAPNSGPFETYFPPVERTCPFWDIKVGVPRPHLKEEISHAAWSPQTL